MNRKSEGQLTKNYDFSKKTISIKCLLYQKAMTQTKSDDHFLQNKLRK